MAPLSESLAKFARTFASLKNHLHINYLAAIQIAVPQRKAIVGIRPPWQSAGVYSKAIS